MQALRLNDVLSRVVAWHNRHPLARRIQASQVHSIGEVLLPFASAQPLGAVAPAASADVADLASAHAAAVASALLAAIAEPAPGPPDAPTAHQPGDGDADGEAAAAAPSADPAPGHTAPAGLDIDLFDSPHDAAPAPPQPGGIGAEAFGSSDDDDDGEAALVMPVLDADGTLKSLPEDSDTASDGAPPADRPDLSELPELPGSPESTATSAPPTDPFDLPEGRDDPPATPLPAPDTDPDAPTSADGPTGPAPDPQPPETPPETPPAAGDEPALGDSLQAPPAEPVPTVSALRRRAEAEAGGAMPPPGPTAPATPAAAMAMATMPALPVAAAAGPAWRRWLAALRTALTGRRPGMPALRAAFSRDFIWPLKPHQVARFAQRHGNPQPLAPADWPRRQVETDTQRLSAARQQGLAHTVHLHVLTAAIGVGDRRIRLLLDADGAVIGPRAYSRARVGTAASLAAVMLAGGGWTLRPVVDADLGAASLAALSASASLAALSASATLAALPASAAASAAASASAAAMAAASAAAQASAVATADAAANPASAAASAATLADAAASALAATGAPHAQAPASAAPAVATASAPPGAGADAQAAAAGDAGASAPQASIRPVIADEDRRLARAQGQQLRGEAPTPPAPVAAEASVVYAVVTRPSRQREAAASGLALMRAAGNRLPPPVPEHGELMLSQGEWRAAWWPFASLADAERARVLLAGRGVKADVVEF